MEKENLTPRELMALSRMFNEHKEAIKSLIAEQLNERVPQVIIARDFGITTTRIARIARANNINYYSPKEN